jgi:3-oxoacyl-[acyl-carrier-protein] synthase I
MMAMQNDLLPGSLNTRTRDPAIRSNYLLDNREAKLRRVLSNSFGFGGNNCSLVLARTD